jgi:hypothetical protein
MMSLNADGSSCRSCRPESSKAWQSGVTGNSILTSYYLQEKFNVVLGKLRLAEQAPDEVVNQDARDDLEVVEFRNQNDEVRGLLSRLILILGD